MASRGFRTRPVRIQHSHGVVIHDHGVSRLPIAKHGKIFYSLPAADLNFWERIRVHPQVEVLPRLHIERKDLKIVAWNRG